MVGSLIFHLGFDLALLRLLVPTPTDKEESYPSSHYKATIRFLCRAARRPIGANRLGSPEQENADLLGEVLT